MRARGARRWRRELGGGEFEFLHGRGPFPETSLAEDQEAVVLQLPAQPMTASEEEAQKRAAYAG